MFNKPSMIQYNKCDILNNLMSSEYKYFKDICEKNSTVEQLSIISVDYIKSIINNKDIKTRMCIVNWIVSVFRIFRKDLIDFYGCDYTNDRFLSDKYKYSYNKSFQLAITYYDVYVNMLTANSITCTHNELLGIAASCVLLASKIEDDYNIDINDIVNYSRNNVTHKQVNNIQIIICEKLNYNLYYPTVIEFIDAYSNIIFRSNNKSKQIGSKQFNKIISLAYHVSNISIAVLDMCNIYKQSDLALAILLLTLEIRDATNNKFKLRKETRYVLYRYKENIYSLILLNKDVIMHVYSTIKTYLKFVSKNK